MKFIFLLLVSITIACGADEQNTEEFSYTMPVSDKCMEVLKKASLKANLKIDKLLIAQGLNLNNTKNIIVVDEKRHVVQLKFSHEEGLKIMRIISCIESLIFDAEVADDDVFGGGVDEKKLFLAKEKAVKLLLEVFENKPKL